MYTMITDAQFSNLSQLVLMYVNKSTISQDEIVNIVASLSNVVFICFYTRNYYFDFILFIYH